MIFLYAMYYFTTFDACFLVSACLNFLFFLLRPITFLLLLGRAVKQFIASMLESAI